MMPITFVVAVNSNDIYDTNLLASLRLLEVPAQQIIVQRGFSSAARAYNDAIDKSENDLIVFAHQDILFPRRWVNDLQRALDSLEESDFNWGVLGCYGVPLYGPGRGYVYSPGRGVLGRAFDRPVSVRTLDEIVLIMAKSKGLRFDERLPHFHFYGADICMAAAKRGMRSYAISALCVHNTQQPLVLPKEFYASYAMMKQIWRDCLPIRTTCITITRFDWEFHLRRLNELYLRHIRRKIVGAGRVMDGRQLLAQIESMAPASENDTKGCSSL